MAIIFFSGLTPKGEFNECSFSGLDIESCFDTLNHLTNAGWQLVSAQLLDSPSKVRMELPVEAFTGELMKPQLLQLERTWKYLLDDQMVMIKQHAARAIHHATESLTRARERRAYTNKRITILFERLATIQARIQETKAEWGVK